jgi:hypothetical protein
VLPHVDRLEAVYPDGVRDEDFAPAGRLADARRVVHGEADEAVTWS